MTMRPSCSVCLLLVGLQCTAVNAIELISLERQQELLEENTAEAMESENIDINAIRWDFGDYNPTPEDESDIVEGDEVEGGLLEDGDLLEDQACYTDLAWHPNYDAGWKEGFCINTRTCDSPMYSTELECCQKAYGGQTSNYCLSRLESAPTHRPTEPPTAPPTAGPTAYTEYWYPNYEVAWKVSYCLSTERGEPVPRGRPLYLSNADCCVGAYAGQTSETCFQNMANPPTQSPTTDSPTVSPTTEIAPFYYPRYEEPWTKSGCSNTRPLPFRIGDRPVYQTQVECCLVAYGGQWSGVCLSELENPPSTSPTPQPTVTGQTSPSPPTENSSAQTSAQTSTLWYPRYDEPWSSGGCSNALPLPFSIGDRPVFSTHLECCQSAYGGQASNNCVSELESPPTQTPTVITEQPTVSPTGILWYPDFETEWPKAGCKSARPHPFAHGSRRTYLSETMCCKKEYAGQDPPVCLCNSDSIPQKQKDKFCPPPET